MEKVKVYSKTITIPTYEPAEPNRLPMFLDKRVYQGSSGKVYPHTVTESISDEKVDKEYNAIYLENEYLLVMILPEIGGKIQRIYDKTNGYDAVYYNHVIKPALVGLAGPWVSGGIEFNWPQHHRPSTFDPVDYTIQENEDGSATVWVGEIEKMYHTKGMAGFTLYPDKAYLEIKGQLYNPTEQPQTFLWWANPAVAVNDHTQSIFPPDVHAVMDHGKRDASNFPIATGTYYKMDYSEGVDISRYKNIPVPTSYMAYHSDYDFVGNYDHSKEAGLLHIADHHISPGKKQWTWGCGDFGKAWDRNLTDEDGPYIELMTGMFTDNQPDFTFIAPYEEKRFKQYFMPYKGVNAVKNATLDAMINLEIEEDKAIVFVYSPRKLNATISLEGLFDNYISESVELTPKESFTKAVSLSEDDLSDITNLTLAVKDSEGKVLVSYSPLPEANEKTPKPAQAAKKPEEIHSLEELYLTALHLEQYRHATYSPEPYYLEGLRRDPTDARLNNGYGMYLYKKGEWKKSVKYFKAAIKKLTWKNPNPYDCEPYYNLGLAYKMLNMPDKAYDAFYKSIWSAAMQDKGFYQLACLSCWKKEYDKAAEFVEQSLARGYHNLKARNLKTTLLRLAGKTDEAIAFAKETIKIDPLDFGGRYELYRLTGDFIVLNDLTTIMRNDLQNYIELSLNYADASLLDESAKVLALISQADKALLHYYMAYYSNSEIELEIAAGCKGICFTNSPSDIIILKYAIENNSSDAQAPYLLGNLLYDKGQYDSAIEYWELSKSVNPQFADVYRNLSLAYFNKKGDKDKALENMEKAYRYDKGNARIFFELDQLYKRLNYPVKKRLMYMVDEIDILSERDDLYTEYITLLNDCKYYERALKAIKAHKFHPWEGGEGKITSQYKKANMGLAKIYYMKEDYEEATLYLKAALEYPENLGEGKLINDYDNDIYYYLGCVTEKLDLIEAHEYFKLAMRGDDDLSSAKYYNDQPPEMFYYRAAAAKKLGDIKKAKQGFNKMINYYREHIDDVCEIDYFAVSLPDFLVFEADLDSNNYAHCCYMAALGYIGLDQKEKALELAEKGLERNASHQGLIEIKTENDAVPEHADEQETYLKAASWATEA